MRRESSSLPPRDLTRGDLPPQITPESLRHVPVDVLRAFADPRNGVLSDAEQQQYDEALHQLMAKMAERVRSQVSPDGLRAIARMRASHPGSLQGRVPMTREQRTLEQMARRVEAQVGAVEQLAPGVDWSFALPTEPAGLTEAQPATATGPAVPGTATVDEVEKELTDHVEMVQLMGEIAEVGRRTLDLEQQREQQNTRSALFGVLVSVAVIAAGWAPVVVATPHQRVWIGILTVATCAVAGAVYAGVRRWQKAQERFRTAEE